MGLKHSSHVRLVTDILGDHSQLTDLSVQNSKLNCVVSGEEAGKKAKG